MIFNDGFALFERALKQYWYKFHGRTSGGINVVRRVCEGGKPDVKRSILVDQRATGLLGNYIVSLRGMGLIQGDSLRIVEDVADRVLVDITFPRSRSWMSSWSGLDQTFSPVGLASARRRLGSRLFGGESQEMTQAARAVLSRKSSKAWASVARKELDPEQARLSEATTTLIRFEKAAISAFGELLRGETSFTESTRNSLQTLAAATHNAEPFPSSWSATNRLRSVISNALSALELGSDPAATLLGLHIAVTREVRQNEPWLRHLGETPAGLQRWRPDSGTPDFRFKNLRTLLRQTRWRPHAD